jgi:hypothetical protein
VMVDSKPVRDPFLLSGYAGIKSENQLEFAIRVFADKSFL